MMDILIFIAVFVLMYCGFRFYDLFVARIDIYKNSHARIKRVLSRIKKSKKQSKKLP